MTSRRASIICLAALAAAPVLAAADNRGEGHLFLSPQQERRGKKFKDGRSIVAYHQSGTVVSGNPKGPRSVIWRPAGGPDTFEIKAGAGKWKGITGKGRLLGELRNRSDRHVALTWEMSWEVSDRKNAALTGAPGDHAYHDQGLSFHGPRIKEPTMTLANGVTPVVGNQSGVLLLSDDREAKSPATSPPVTTVTPSILAGKNLGGVGKWKGFSGYGKTLGMLRARTGDHYMLKSEIHWNLDPQNRAADMIR